LIVVACAAEAQIKGNVILNYKLNVFVEGAFYLPTQSRLKNVSVLSVSTILTFASPIIMK